MHALLAGPCTMCEYWVLLAGSSCNVQVAVLLVDLPIVKSPGCSMHTVTYEAQADHKSSQDRNYRPESVYIAGVSDTVVLFTLASPI